MINKSIALVGPMCSGKSTLSFFLGEIISMKVFNLDYIKKEHINIHNSHKFSYEKDVEDQLRHQSELEKFFLFNYFIDLPLPGIYDFGSGMLWNFSIEEIIKISELFDYFILVLPSFNKKEGYDILKERFSCRKEKDPEIDFYNIDKRFNAIKTFYVFYLKLATYFSWPTILTKYPVEVSILHLIEQLGLNDFSSSHLNLNNEM